MSVYLHDHISIKIQICIIKPKYKITYRHIYTGIHGRLKSVEIAHVHYRNTGFLCILTYFFNYVGVCETPQAA